MILSWQCVHSFYKMLHHSLHLNPAERNACTQNACTNSHHMHAKRSCQCHYRFEIIQAVAVSLLKKHLVFH